MPLPDDVQLEAFGFWRALREQRGLYVARERLRMMKNVSQRQGHEDRPKTRPDSCETCERRRHEANVQRGWIREGLNYKTREPRERKGTGTHIDVSFYVPNQDEVAGAGVADVCVDGDRASGVALDGVGGLWGGDGITGDGAGDETAGRVDVGDETGGGGGGPEHFGTKQRGERVRVACLKLGEDNLGRDSQPLGVLIPLLI